MSNSARVIEPSLTLRRYSPRSDKTAPGPVSVVAAVGIDRVCAPVDAIWRNPPPLRQLSAANSQSTPMSHTQQEAAPIPQEAWLPASPRMHRYQHRHHMKRPYPIINKHRSNESGDVNVPEMRKCHHPFLGGGGIGGDLDRGGAQAQQRLANDFVPEKSYGQVYISRGTLKGKFGDRARVKNVARQSAYHLWTALL